MPSWSKHVKRPGCLRFLAVAAACGLASVLSARAESETIDGVVWTYTLDGTSATVTGAEPAAGALSIPPRLGGCPVTSIGTGDLHRERSLFRMLAVDFPDASGRGQVHLTGRLCRL